MVTKLNVPADWKGHSLTHSFTLSLSLVFEYMILRIFSCASPFPTAEWQIYLLLFGLFLASLMLFYIFFENSDSFWNFPQAPQKISTLFDGSDDMGSYSQSDDMALFGPLDM